MTSSTGALAAVDRVLARGGDADDVLRAVLDTLHASGIAYAAIRFVEQGALVDGPQVGDPAGETLTVPVAYGGEPVGELEASVEDRAFLDRVANLISAYVLVGWDTGGEDWAP